MSVVYRCVPDDFRGVWKRTLSQTDTQSGQAPQSDGHSWERRLQTSSWYADLCIPEASLRGREALPLAALSAAQLAALADQQGVVGVTQFDHAPEVPICTWLRRTDYQPPGLHPDAGMILFDRPDRLIEIGVHEDYNAVWERLPDSLGRFIALAGCTPGGADNGERMLVAGSYMMWMRPRGARWPRGLTPGYTLADVLLHSPHEALKWLDCDVSFGRLAGKHWEIEHATLPEREAQAWAWQAQRTDATQARVDVNGHASNWQVLEWSCADELARG
jgi:hypothetical protein